MFRPAVDVPSGSIKGTESLHQLYKEVSDPWDQHSPDLNRQCSELVYSTYRAVVSLSLSLSLCRPSLGPHLCQISALTRSVTM
jgi:hypothetical protein